jgi:hypothetical protein
MVKRSNLMLLALVSTLSFLTASCGRGSVPSADAVTPGKALAAVVSSDVSK